MSLDNFNPKQIVVNKQLTPLAEFAKNHCDACLNPTSQMKPCPEFEKCIGIKTYVLLQQINNHIGVFMPKISTTNKTSQTEAKSTAELVLSIIWETGTTSTGKACDRAFEAKNSVNGKLTSAYAELKRQIEQSNKDHDGCYMDGYGYWVTKGNEPYIGRVKTEGRKKF